MLLLFEEAHWSNKWINLTQSNKARHTPQSGFRVELTEDSSDPQALRGQTRGLRSLTPCQAMDNQNTASIHQGGDE